MANKNGELHMADLDMESPEENMAGEDDEALEVMHAGGRQDLNSRRLVPFAKQSN